jgi:hypothetical protein
MLQDFGDALPEEPDLDTPPPPSSDALTSPVPEAAPPASGAALPQPNRLAAWRERRAAGGLPPVLLTPFIGAGRA